MNDDTTPRTDEEDTAPATPQDDSPQATEASAVATAESPKQQVSPLVLTIGFIIIVLLGIIIFQNIVPKGGGKSASAADSPALDTIKADIQTRRAQLNRERLSLGMEPLADGSMESAEEIAARLENDADTLASLASSLQNLLTSKDQQIDDIRAESIAALKEQQRLRERLNTVNDELRRAMVEASMATTLQGELDRARATIEALNAEIAQLRDEPNSLRSQLMDANRRRSEAEARAAELEALLRKRTLFASSEGELMKEAIALFQALRKLEGSTEAQLSAAYSRFGAELNAEVLQICNFATGSAEVRPELESNLRTIPIEVPSDAMIFVVGYASETGNVDSNRTLSSDRATAVARMLDSIKRPEQRVQAVYLGQTDRFSATVPEENQRVEIWQIIPKSSAASDIPAPPEPARSSSGAPPLQPLPESIR